MTNLFERVLAQLTALSHPSPPAPAPPPAVEPEPAALEPRVLAKYQELSGALRGRQITALTKTRFRVVEGDWRTYLEVDGDTVRPLLWLDPVAKKLQVSPELAAQLGEPLLRKYGTDPEAWEQELMRPHRVTRSAHYTILEKANDGTRRFTLGVAYPANQVDAHGDYMRPETVEQMCWELPMTPNSIGLFHADGTAGAGTPVEKYIYRGPDWHINGQVVKAGDFLLGAIWDEPAWELIQRGEITGWSIQGWGRRVE